MFPAAQGCFPLGQVSLPFSKQQLSEMFLNVYMMYMSAHDKVSACVFDDVCDWIQMGMLTGASIALR